MKTDGITPFLARDTSDDGGGKEAIHSWTRGWLGEFDLVVKVDPGDWDWGRLTQIGTEKQTPGSHQSKCKCELCKRNKSTS